jgi:hypothetical protein
VIDAFDDCNPNEPVTSKNLFLGELSKHTYLPLLLKNYQNTLPSLCPAVSVNQYTLIPYEGGPIDHPDYLHGDLNLFQRGYNPVDGVALTLVDYSGSTAATPPQLPGLFGNNRLPTFNRAYRVNDWNWSCGTPHGCPGAPLTHYPTTLIGMVTTPGEAIYPPDRSPNIFSQNGRNYKALVLYAEETRLTLTFIRRDSVGDGYSVHLENFCVDPNLLATYRAQVGPDGFRISGVLPGIEQDQVLGSALSELRVAIRDRGIFFDPRSRKDWWQGK